jgi:hypothetical protein
VPSLKLITTGVLTIAALTSGGVLLARSQVTDPMTVACFERAELRLDGTFPGTTVALADAPPGSRDAVQVPIDDAVGICTDLWRDGVLNSPDGSAVPDLTVCVMRDGTAAVVPGPSGVCGSIGLPERAD